MSRAYLALAVLGPRNLTRISHPLEVHPKRDLVNHRWSLQDVLEELANQAMRKTPGRDYYVVNVDERTSGRRRKDVLYRWHVGDGFDHEEGWWVDASND